MATFKFEASRSIWRPASNINGMTIAGEQDVPLENKERVEFLKGIAGVESGVASAGGLINYVTRRPALITVTGSWRQIIVGPLMGTLTWDGSSAITSSTAPA